jgi:hypothetical protein
MEESGFRILTKSYRSGSGKLKKLTVPDPEYWNNQMGLNVVVVI